MFIDPCSGQEVLFSSFPEAAGVSSRFSVVPAGSLWLSGGEHPGEPQERQMVPCSSPSLLRILFLTLPMHISAPMAASFLNPCLPRSLRRKYPRSAPWPVPRGLGTHWATSSLYSDIQVKLSWGQTPHQGLCFPLSGHRSDRERSRGCTCKSSGRAPLGLYSRLAF